MKYTKLFSEIGKNDIATAGGKGANLGEMTQANLPVPPGFVVLSNAYFDFVKRSNVDAVIARETKDINIEKNKDLEEASKNIQKAILGSSIPALIEEEIVESYKKLGDGHELVAIRSSATAEDLPDASFAGQQESYMNVSGNEEVVETVKRVWASLFEPRSIYYRQQKGYDHLKVGIAVPIEKMITSQASGIMFTINPIDNDQSKITIEAVFGLGDAAVSGSVTPDQYLVDKKTLEILKKDVVTQTRMLIKPKPGAKVDDTKRFRPHDDLIWIDVSHPYQKEQKLKDDEIKNLARAGLRVEEHYQFPQDMEWAKEDGKVYLVQTRPITTIKVEDIAGNQGAEDEIEKRVEEVKNLPSPLLSGIGASPGIATGLVRIIHSPTQLDLVKKGDVLVTEMTTPDFVPAMKRAVAIVTDTGGRTSHAAIVSRELGIPAVVGTELATKHLKSHEVITVDGSLGKVYQGKVNLAKETTISEETQTANFLAQTNERNRLNLPAKTATKLYVILAEPDLAEDIAKKNIDGVGLLRAEFMIAQIGEHPRFLIDHKKGDKFVEEMTIGLTKFAKAFDPRPIVYRATDFRTNEYRNLRGGEKYETHEENPMLGFRGVMRYINDPEVFKLELTALKHVRRYHKNLHLMLPFVRTPEELTEAKKIMAEMDLYRSSSFKLWIMVEVPSTVIDLERFIGVGIDGISIGSNDLTQLILGIDRDNGKAAYEFDERNDAVQWALERVIKTSAKHGITSSICGQAPSDYPELVEKLVDWGINSISVNPDVVEKTREIIAKAEYNIIRRR